MTKTPIGKRVLRNEDPRLLTGQAQFVDDVEIPGLLHAAFLRSDHAHARLLGMDVSVARQRPGEAGHRRGHPLVPGDHSLDGPLLRGEDLVEQGLGTARHSPSLSHGAVGEGAQARATKKEPVKD